MQTIAGVFDTVDEARNAREALLDSGFDASEVRLQSNPAAQESDTLTTTDRIFGSQKLKNLTFIEK